MVSCYFLGMSHVVVNLEGDGSTQDLADRGMKMIHLGNDAPPVRITYLSGGMASGKPSCGIVIELPEIGSYVLCEISAVLLVNAARLVEVKAEQEGHHLR